MEDMSEVEKLLFFVLWILLCISIGFAIAKGAGWIVALIIEGIR